MCIKLIIIKIAVLCITLSLAIFALTSKTLNKNMKSLIILLVLLLAYIYVISRNYYFTMQCNNLFSHFNNLEDNQLAFQEICKRYPKNKDRQNQIAAYLASLSYNSTSHELLEAFQF